MPVCERLVETFTTWLPRDLACLAGDFAEFPSMTFYGPPLDDPDSEDVREYRVVPCPLCRAAHIHGHPEELITSEDLWISCPLPDARIAHFHDKWKTRLYDADDEGYKKLARWWEAVQGWGPP